MNICVITVLDYPGKVQYTSATGEVKRMTFDGGVRKMIPLLKHAQKRGHQVIMVIPSMKSHDQYEVYDGFPIYHVGPSNRFPFKSNFYLSGSSLALKTFNKAMTIIKTHKIDIVHIAGLTITCSIPGWVAAKLCHKPIVLQTDDLTPHYAIEMGLLNPNSLISKLSLFVYDKLPPKADMVMATNFIKQRLISRGMPPEKIVAISMGADTDVFHPGRDSEKIKNIYGLCGYTVILYQGLVCKAFGIELLLHAMAKVTQVRSDVKLLVVGFHRNREKVEFEQDEEIISFREKAEQLGIKDRVIFTGPQPHEVIPDFIAASDICVNPMPGTIVHRAGSPGKVFEYMAGGKPVVTTGLESIEGVITDEETGLIARPDAQDIAEKILWLVENPNVRDRLGKKARERVIAEFTWEKLGDKLIDVFNQAMRK